MEAFKGVNVEVVAGFCSPVGWPLHGLLTLPDTRNKTAKGACQGGLTFRGAKLSKAKHSFPFPLSHWGCSGA